MPPLPKDSATRRRRNRSAGARTLRIVPGLKTPKLPAGRAWHERTEAWWADLWKSAMAPEYDPADINELYLLAVLVNTFWLDPSKELAAEIRLQRQCFGLTPIDRRRLQWETDKGEEAEGRRQQRQTKARPRVAPRKDPRAKLA